MHYEKELEGLNEYQREAVVDENDICIVNANVGSGKTTVLISKIVYIHYAKSVSYRDMMEIIQEEKILIKYKNRLKKRLEKAMSIETEDQKISRYNDEIFQLVNAFKRRKKKTEQDVFFRFIAKCKCFIR